MRQTDLILNHLKDKGSITPLDALNLYGCFRLSARIFEIKDQGYEIITNKVEHNGKKFASYVLKAS
jgi:hypothetical protein